MLLDLLFHHNRPDARFQNWNAWGITWVGNWGDSWGPYEVAEKRPLPDNPRYAQAEKDHAHWRQLRDEDDVLLALLQHFVMQEA